MTATPEQAEAEPQRPELHVVTDQEATTEATVEVPPETDTEVTGPVQVLDAEGRPVTPRAPWDVRARDAVLRAVAGVPGFGRAPASFSESMHYSQQGDWATSGNGLKRVIHGLATIVAFTLTWPLVEGLGALRTKPIGLVLLLTVLLAAAHVVGIL